MGLGDASLEIREGFSGEVTAGSWTQVGTAAEQGWHPGRTVLWPVSQSRRQGVGGAGERGETTCPGIPISGVWLSVALWRCHVVRDTSRVCKKSVVGAPWDSPGGLPSTQEGAARVETPCHLLLGCVQGWGVPGAQWLLRTQCLLAGGGPVTQACDDKGVSTVASAATRSSHGVPSSSGHGESSGPQFPHLWNESSSQEVWGSLPA